MKKFNIYGFELHRSGLVFSATKGERLSVVAQAFRDVILSEAEQFIR